MVAQPARGDPIDAALERLSRALDLLEQTAEARLEGDSRRAERDEAISVLEDDRSRLAVELDGALARNRSLEHAADEVSRRLEGARATVQGLLGLAEIGEAARGDQR
ncbi:MAG: DUF4164 family protein [Methylobacteriaceae bacterium]|nr:DUF4164 family protein [Methylobacteriaceae bacterium]